MKQLSVNGQLYDVVDIHEAVGSALNLLPYSLRIVAENTMRQDASGESVREVVARAGGVVPFMPNRLIMQDMLGLPLLVDLMALKSAVSKAGGDAAKVDMSLPVDLVLDHSMTIENWSEVDSFEKNEAREFEVNNERFAFMKACGERFPSLNIIPPQGGIIHQVNLEYLGRVVEVQEKNGCKMLVPDSCFGTDSHTTMINGLGVLGYGIGGLEAEAIMFGEPATINVPKVVGVEVCGKLAEGVTATDVALTVTEALRKVGVVDCFVELFGPGYPTLSVADRATISNMAPEYGATCVYCPIDDNTLKYMRETGRSEERIAFTEAYVKAQSLWFDKSNNTIVYDQVVNIDLGNINRSISGPSRPEDRVELTDVINVLPLKGEKSAAKSAPVEGKDYCIRDGDIVIAAITSCTNTANPFNMMLAGLMAKKAVEKGLKVKPHVKASLAPGSRVVTRYLERSGLQNYLDALGFNLTCYSCSTCNGMAGPLSPEHEQAIRDNDLNCVAVLSGNRNFPGRIHPLAQRNVLASPPLVVAYALAGTILKDITKEPLGIDTDGKAVTLDELWPSTEEVLTVIADSLKPEDFTDVYGVVSRVNERWNQLQVDTGEYEWLPSTNVTWPGYLEDIPTVSQFSLKLKRLRPLVILGDSITTDHITPAGSIPEGSAAADFLKSCGVAPRNYNAYGTRRGSSDIVIRSTFSNVRLKNEILDGKEGSWTKLMPEGWEMSVYDAIEKYVERGQKLLVIAGKDYGCGSSRDTAAKAPWLAGIRAVVAESFERIHRSNLVNMGIAPLQFPEGVTRKTLQLNGTEEYDIDFADDLRSAEMTIFRQDGREGKVTLAARFYNDNERNTFRHGGLLHRVFRDFVK